MYFDSRRRALPSALLRRSARRSNREAAGSWRESGLGDPRPVGARDSSFPNVDRRALRERKLSVGGGALLSRADSVIRLGQWITTEVTAGDDDE